jgi:hypothetical protein
VSAKERECRAGERVRCGKRGLKVLAANIFKINVDPRLEPREAELVTMASMPFVVSRSTTLCITASAGPERLPS